MKKGYFKAKDVGFELGQVFGRWTINSEDLFQHSGRKQLQVKCSCGTIGYVRADRLRAGLTLGCKHCQQQTYYPETRISSAKHYNGLHIIFLRRLSNPDNLKRGNKIIEINLSIEDLYDLLIKQEFKCALTGIKLNVLHIQPGDSNASIDRIDSNKGYVKDNIQWVIKDVNKMKNDLNQDYFIHMCKLIAQNKYDHGNPDPSVNLND